MVAQTGIDTNAIYVTITPFFLPKPLFMRMSKAIGAQVATLAAAVTVAAMALPVLADQTVELSPVVQPVRAFELSNSAYAQNIISMFSRQGAASLYDNTSLETSAFDFQAYVANTCYRPTDFDMKNCEQNFGPYANLRITLENGTLRTILKNAKIIADRPGEAAQAPAAAPVVQTLQEAAKEPVAPALTEEQERNKLRAQRVAELWTACQEAYPDNGDAKLCFQRNYRLIDRDDATIRGNIY